MTKIIFNETYEYTIQTYNRTTTFTDGTMNSTILINLGRVSADNRSIYNLGNTTITLIQLKVDNAIIDTLNNINAKIEVISEILNSNQIIVEMTLNLVEA